MCNIETNTGGDEWIVIPKDNSSGCEIIVTREDYNKIVDAIENPPEPNEKLKKLMGIKND